MCVVHIHKSKIKRPLRQACLVMLKTKQTNNQKQKQALALTPRTAGFCDLHMKSGFDFQAECSSRMPPRRRQRKSEMFLEIHCERSAVLHCSLIVIILSSTEHGFRTKTPLRPKSEPKQTNSSTVDPTTSHATDRNQAVMMRTGVMFPAVQSCAPTRIQILVH